MREVVLEFASEHLENVRVKESFAAASCPFHADRNPSFWIALDTGSWGCFSCEERGSNLKLLMRALGYKNRSAEKEIDAALKDQKKTRAAAVRRKKRKARASFLGTHTLPESLLGVFNFTPIDLVEAGFSEQLLIENNIGYDRERDRIIFPIRDLAGNLIGLSGRATLPGALPKYKVYQGRFIRDGKEMLGELGEWFPDYSSTDIRNHLWGANFIFEDIFHRRSEQLIVVEGYKARLWLVQHGWTNTVAIMGARMSDAQERIIRQMGTPTWILLDNNDAGQSGANDICDRLGMATFPVYRCNYPSDMSEDAQPDDLTTVEEIDWVLSNATKARGKRRYGYKRTKAVSTDR
jgi:DNA primase